MKPLAKPGAVTFMKCGTCRTTVEATPSNLALLGRFECLDCRTDRVEDCQACDDACTPDEHAEACSDRTWVEDPGRHTCGGRPVHDPPPYRLQTGPRTKPGPFRRQAPSGGNRGGLPDSPDPSRSCNSQTHRGHAAASAQGPPPTAPPHPTPAAPTPKPTNRGGPDGLHRRRRLNLLARQRASTSEAARPLRLALRAAIDRTQGA
ncbi:MAG: hypothetical protein HYT80_00485 [Euryarchaeota archaeon]|nr:hypothetical protein [Euryarchaeota archaeon]